MSSYTTSHANAITNCEDENAILAMFKTEQEYEYILDKTGFKVGKNCHVCKTCNRQVLRNY